MRVTKTEREQKEYLAYLDALHYEDSTLSTAKSEGRAEGRAESIRAMARHLPVSQISLIIGMSEQEIDAILQNN